MPVPAPAAPRTDFRLGIHDESHFPPPCTDTGRNSPGRPNLTVSRLPRKTTAPLSGDCSSATPLPINPGTSPSFEHVSETARTVCPAKLGTTTALGSPNAIVGADAAADCFLLASTAS